MLYIKGDGQAAYELPARIEAHTKPGTAHISTFSIMDRVIIVNITLLKGRRAYPIAYLYSIKGSNILL